MVSILRQSYRCHVLSGLVLCVRRVFYGIYRSDTPSSLSSTAVSPSSVYAPDAPKRLSCVNIVQINFRTSEPSTVGCIIRQCVVKKLFARCVHTGSLAPLVVNIHRILCASTHCLIVSLNRFSNVKISRCPIVSMLVDNLLQPTLPPCCILGAHQPGSSQLS